jgi:phage terminase large subunit-like protein
LPPLNTFDFTPSKIFSIEPDGFEEVYDIEVDRTENFIANGVVSHNTRWHEDDLSGRLLELMKKDPNAAQWDIVNFPAIKTDNSNADDPREIGEALWPQKYDLNQLEQIKATVGPRGWSSLYQQTPTPDGGGLFSDQMFEFVELPAENLFDYSFIMADTSYKEKQENDFTVFVLFGVIKDQIYVRNVWRKQIKSSDVEAQIEPWIKQSIKYSYRGTYIEPKGHGIYLNQKFAQRGLMIPSEKTIQEFYSDRRFEKVQRANNVVPHLSHIKVKINKAIPNKEDLVAECLLFP